MRVLEVARQFYPKVGGIESSVLNLSRGLAARGHTVEIVTLDADLRTGLRIDSPATIDSIPIHRIPWFGSRRYPIALSWLRLIDGFDVLHIHAIDFFIDSAALTRRVGLHNKPIVVTTHGGIFHTRAWRGLKNLYWRNILKRSLSTASKVVAVSDGDASLFASIVSADRLVTIPNGVDTAFANAPADRVRGRLVCIGRVTDSKAIDQVIHLLALVARNSPDAELFVAGPDEDGTVERLARQSARLGLEARVRILGALPIAELAALSASAHLYVSAAQHEGFGITTVEALSAGTPVLVTRTGVHEEVVKPDVNGWFWSGKADAESAATLRNALLLSDTRLDDMRTAARASAAPFDWEISTGKYERVLESAYRENQH